MMRLASMCFLRNRTGILPKAAARRQVGPIRLPRKLDFCFLWLCRAVLRCACEYGGRLSVEPNVALCGGNFEIEAARAQQ
jgi:hypothetical protein